MFEETGSVGLVGCFSFYPAKILGCFGDGGAIFTNDYGLAEKLRMVSNHGMKVRYYHDMIGVNSRLDSIQAAVLRVKLKNLNNYVKERNRAAQYYDKAFKDIESLAIPYRDIKSSHTFHQYTLKIE